MGIFKRFWFSLNPKFRRYGMIGAVLISAIGLVSFFSGGSSKAQNTSRQATIRHVLTDSSPHNFTMDQIAKNIDELRREGLEKQQQIKQLNAQLLKIKKDSSNASKEQYKQLSQKIAYLQEENKQLNSRMHQTGVQTIANTPHSEGDHYLNHPINWQDKNAIFANAPLPQLPEEKSKEGSITSVQTYSAPKLDDIGNKEKSVAQDMQKDDFLYIPAGSILTGTLVTGMDAPTSDGTQDHPFPALLRLQKEAILPNKYSEDIKECFLLVGGYGDLSSERVYLRGETLSCVRNNGDVTEAELKGYVAGEDGLAGVRGRLVSRQGQLIAKSFVSGFFGGLGEGFQKVPVPTINFSNGDAGSSVQYQSMMSQGMFQSAAAKGAGDSLKRIADFYIKMAEKMFPVIEISAGRQVDVILEYGVKLKVKAGDQA
ncbi:TrbI/VirB10 family protein [Piscirickettsia litoralis]|uniref:TrbI/VirB10 family protein n=1 Tax=Piscirickettsia litoralis TaxID=1891921 RepID=UPI0009817B18|nr:TrbI/VirB10 family protein [Piscirickettsia litoralis]